MCLPNINLLGLQEGLTHFHLYRLGGDLFGLFVGFFCVVVGFFFGFVFFSLLKPS